MEAEKKQIILEPALREVFLKLEKSPLVAAVILYGSHAINQNSKNSDYDILVVLYKNIKILSSFTYVNRTPTDIFYTNIRDINLINCKKILLNTKEDWLVYWIQTGYVCFDKTGVIAKFKNKECKRIINKEEKYNYSYHLNHDYVQNARYNNSKKYDESIILQIKLLHSISQILPIYFCLNNISWRGEKFALQYIKNNDLKLYKMYSNCLFSSVNKKFKLYSKVLNYITKKSGGLWEKNISVDSSLKTQPKNKSFLKKLIKK